jgi:hypothetical protein
MDIPLQPVSKPIREFVRAVDLLLHEISEKSDFNDFERLLLTSYANRLSAANSVLQSRALKQEAKDLRNRSINSAPLPLIK